MLDELLDIPDPPDVDIDRLIAEIPDFYREPPPACEEEPSLGLVWDWVSIADPSTMDDDEVLTLLRECARIRSFVDARELRALARFAELRPAGGGAGFSEFAGDEVAVELRVTPGYADDQLHLAVALDTRLRATRDALAAGLIDKARATAVVELTDPLPADKAQAVEQQVLRRAPEQNLAQLRRSLRYRVARVDPEGAARRHAERRRDRRVTIRPVEDAMAQLSAYAPAPEVAAAYARIDALARRARTPGDGRTVDAVRTDVMMDLLLGRTTRGVGENVKVEVQLTVPISMLLRLDDKPGELAGYGPIPASLARELAAEAGTWRRLLTDPASGMVLDYGTTRYRPPTQLARFVRARNRTCVHPGCVRPAAKCELDHTVPFPQGPTAEGNLGPLCKHGHRAKHEAGWQLTQPLPGYFVWVTPAGRTVVVEPEPIAEPEAEPIPDEPPF